MRHTICLGILATALGFGWSSGAEAQPPRLDFQLTDGSSNGRKGVEMAPLRDGQLYLVELACQQRHAGTSAAIASAVGGLRTADGAVVRTYVESVAMSQDQGSLMVLSKAGAEGLSNVTLSADSETGLPGLSSGDVTVPVGMMPTLFFSAEDGQQDFDLTTRLCGTAFFVRAAPNKRPVVSVQVYASPQQTTKFQAVLQNGATFLTSVIKIMSGAAAGPEVPDPADVTTSTNALQNIYTEFTGANLLHETVELWTGVNTFETSLMQYNFKVYPADIETGKGFIGGHAPMSRYWGLWLNDKVDDLTDSATRRSLADGFQATARARLLGNATGIDADACAPFLDMLVRQNLPPIDIAFIASATLASVPSASEVDLLACNRPQIICHAQNFPDDPNVNRVVPQRLRLNAPFWQDECAPYLQAGPTNQEALLRAIVLQRDAAVQAAQESEARTQVRKDFEAYARQTNFELFPTSVKGFADLGPRFQDQFTAALAAEFGPQIEVTLESAVLADLDEVLRGLRDTQPEASPDEAPEIKARRATLEALYAASFADATRWRLREGLLETTLDTDVVFMALIEAGYQRFACQVGFYESYFTAVEDNEPVQRVLGIDAADDPTRWWHEAFLLFRPDATGLSLGNSIAVRARRNGTQAAPGAVAFEIRNASSQTGIVKDLRVAADGARECSKVPLTDGQAATQAPDA